MIKQILGAFGGVALICAFYASGLALWQAMTYHSLESQCVAKYINLGFERSVIETTLGTCYLKGE